MRPSHPTPEQDLAIARASLARGDLHHTVHHLAAALAADPLNPEFLDTAEALLRSGPENAAQLVPLHGNPEWFAEVALHAWLLARTGNATPALSILLQVAAVKPDVPYLVWARGWLESPDFVRNVEPLSVANAAIQLQRQVDLATHASLTETLLDVLARIRAVHRNSGPLMLATARLARNAGRFQEALDIALAYEREYPDMLAALAAANAYRSMEDVPAALTAYHRALAREPGNLPVWNDIGDMLWEHEREAEALEAYEKVLAHQPAHPWALPSALLLRAQVKKDVTLLREFQRYAQAHPENPRANELHRRLMAPGTTPPPRGEPWVDFLPQPTEAILASLQQVLASVAKGQTKREALRDIQITLSSPEAPSALLSAQLELATLVQGAALRVAVQRIPTPDPRKPWGNKQGLLARLGFGKTQPVLWRYQGTDAFPAVEPPSTEVASKVGALAAKPFRMETWRAEAASLAQQLARVSPLELAAVMVHPPPRPEGVQAWSWLTAVQMAAALVLAETGAGRSLLVDILHGPADWVVGAAVAALTAHALAQPTETEAVVKELWELLKQRPSEGAWCLEYPLSVGMSRLPGLPPDLVHELKTWRDRLESRH